MDRRHASTPPHGRLAARRTARPSPQTNAQQTPGNGIDSSHSPPCKDLPCPPPDLISEVPLRHYDRIFASQHRLSGFPSAAKMPVGTCHPLQLADGKFPIRRDNHNLERFPGNECRTRSWRREEKRNY